MPIGRLPRWHPNPVAPEVDVVPAPVLSHARCRKKEDFHLKIPHRSLIRGIKAERKKGDSAGYAVNVSLQISTPVWDGEIPFNKSAKLKIPTPPELELVEIKYAKVRLKLILADVKIKIINHSNVVLSVKDMSYSMRISKQGDVKGKYKKTNIDLDMC